MEELKIFLRKIYPLNQELLDELVSRWKPVEFSKNGIASDAGVIVKYFMLDEIVSY